ncbi:IS21-like element helper ATPase IstB [Ferrimicrobium sp.]|jgi:DNA replication protein DnaC|uniref:IS21-like element helper ATPase IstB n=1 Tax=Ferrimicrobium sp. TaxID=2926050 RepID=UPI00262E6C77|nr:IS21-like element helper ATPase IstB [Ferrimicrobium sp.]
MLNNQTMSALAKLGLNGMEAAFREQLESVQYLELSFEERFAMLVDREVMDREARRLTTRLRAAKLRHQASLEDLDFRTPRGLDRSAIMGFSSSHWVDAHQNILVTGPTGVGKSYLACALAYAGIRSGHSALYRRVPALLGDLAIARGDGRYLKVLQSLSRAEILVIDDFGLIPLTGSEPSDLLEVLEDRSERKSTIVTSQLPVDSWHEALGDPTLSDAVLDRLWCNAHIISMSGVSMRTKKS